MTKQRKRGTAGDVARALKGNFAPRERLVRGVVTSTTPDAAGAVQHAQIRLEDGLEVPLLGANQPGVALGAGVEAAVSGGRYYFRRATQRGAGAGGYDTTIVLSTPSVDEVETKATISMDGGVAVTAWVIVWQIAEQYRQRQTIGYLVEIRDAATGEIVTHKWAPGWGLEAGEVQGGYTEGDNVLTVVPTSALQPHPAFLFAPRYGVVGVDDELIRYDSTVSPGAGEIQLKTLTPGYAGTVASDHDAGAFVVARTVTATVGGLLPNRAYEARATAQAHDGRKSNPSAWLPFLTAQDTTAPGWSPFPFTPTAEASPRSFVVSWPAANANASDLAHYQVRVSIDGGSTWTTYDAGNGTSWTLPAKPGDRRHFAVRAVDTSGNVSAWSTSAVATAPQEGEPSGTNQLPNSTFETGTLGWSLASTSGTATFVRDATIFQDAAGSGRFSDTRNGALMSTAELTNTTNIAVTPGRRVYLAGYLRPTGAAASDEARLIFQFLAPNGSTILSTHIATLRLGRTEQGAWQYVAVSQPVPLGAAFVRVIVNWTIAAGSGTPSLWIDNLKLVQIGGVIGGLIAHEEMTSAPGVSARPLTTDEEGGLTLRQLTLGAGGLNSETGALPVQGRVTASTATGARVICTVARTVLNADVTAIEFNTEIHDTDGCWAPTDATTRKRLVAKTPGYYMAGGAWACTPAAAARHQVVIRRNGSVFLASNENHAAAGKYGAVAVHTGMFWMAANDYIELCAYQDSGAAVSSVAADVNNQHNCHAYLYRIA